MVPLLAGSRARCRSWTRSCWLWARRSRWTSPRSSTGRWSRRSRWTPAGPACRTHSEIWKSRCSPFTFQPVTNLSIAKTLMCYLSSNVYHVYLGSDFHSVWVNSHWRCGVAHWLACLSEGRPPVRISAGQPGGTICWGAAKRKMEMWCTIEHLQMRSHTDIHTTNPPKIW